MLEDEALDIKDRGHGGVVADGGDHDLVERPRDESGWVGGQHEKIQREVAG